MLVSGLVVPFFVVRRSRAVSMRGKIVVFLSFLVRIVHGSTSIAASLRPQDEKEYRIQEVMPITTIHQQLQKR